MPTINFYHYPNIDVYTGSTKISKCVIQCHMFEQLPRWHQANTSHCSQFVKDNLLLHLEVRIIIIYLFIIDVV